MYRLRISLLVIAAAGLCLAQTESQITSDPVRRVARHISCQCGSCSDDANCMMSAGQCGFCKPARTKIFKMQQAGASDQSIADEFIKEYGPKIYRADPNAFGWIVPYSALALGVLVIVWFVKRYYHPPAAAPAPAAGPSQDALNRYRDQIEQDLAHLD
ncbi:MAG TPA: cytochrome c-type biogenesis protein CcmH [Bryobacteraceae bacterium]|nr:cytochrome c-type biogenesis protein CcmH [Bryobacteraceae bacterium]